MSYAEDWDFLGNRIVLDPPASEGEHERAMGEIGPARWSVVRTWGWFALSMTGGESILKLLHSPTTFLGHGGWASFLVRFGIQWALAAGMGWQLVKGARVAKLIQGHRLLEAFALTPPDREASGTLGRGGPDSERLLD